ncbi:MAG: hypothetical protein AAFR17_03005 [Pseudomonadota bacterium]
MLKALLATRRAAHAPGPCAHLCRGTPSTGHLDRAYAFSHAEMARLMLRVTGDSDAPRTIARLDGKEQFDLAALGGGGGGAPLDPGGHPI